MFVYSVLRFIFEGGFFLVYHIGRKSQQRENIIFFSFLFFFCLKWQCFDLFLISRSFVVWAQMIEPKSIGSISFQFDYFKIEKSWFKRRYWALTLFDCLFSLLFLCNHRQHSSDVLAAAIDVSNTEKSFRHHKNETKNVHLKGNGVCCACFLYCIHFDLCFFVFFAATLTK